MDTINVKLATPETIDRPIRVNVSQNMSVKMLMFMAEQLLKIEVYSLFVNNRKLTDISQLNNDDTILAVNGLSPYIKSNGFFHLNDHYDSYASNSVDAIMNIRIVVLGPQGAGKTSLILRFVLGFFKANDNRTLLEAEYEKTIRLGAEKVMVSILDSAGDIEEYTVSQNWIKNRNAYILAIGIDQLDEWPSTLKYYHMIKEHIQSPNIFLLITKIDLIEKMSKVHKKEAKIKISHIENFCKENHLLLFKTSAKLNKKIHEMFLTIANRCVYPGKRTSNEKPEDASYKLPFVFKALNKTYETCVKCIKKCSSDI